MNVPNALSILRLIFVPVYVVLFFSDIPNAHRWAGAVFFTAALTDMLDGYIARRYNKITRLGRVLDPLADKAMTAAALICLSLGGIVHIWIFIVFVAKEMLMGVGSLFLYKKMDDVMPSNFLGKASTVVFFTFCLVVMLFDIPPAITSWLMTFALALTITAFVLYTYKMLKIIGVRQKK